MASKPLPHNAVDFLLLICGKWLGQEVGQHRLHRNVQSTCHDLTCLLCDCVFSRLADTLISRQYSAHDWKRVCEIFSCCIQWSYPMNGKSRRVNPHIEAMLCLFCVARTILWLFKNASTKRGVEVLRLLKPDFIHLFHVSSCPHAQTRSVISWPLRDRRSFQQIARTFACTSGFVNIFVIQELRRYRDQVLQTQLDLQSGCMNIFC